MDSKENGSKDIDNNADSLSGSPEGEQSENIVSHEDLVDEEMSIPAYDSSKNQDAVFDEESNGEEIVDQTEVVLEDDEDYGESVFSRYKLPIIGVLSAVILALGVFIGWQLTSPMRAQNATDEEVYIGQITTYYNEYITAQNDYYTALNDQFNSYEETAAHVFTDEDITAIVGATDMFEQRATAALESLAGVEAPRSKQSAQEEIAKLANQIIETVVPASIQAQREISAGQTVADFMEISQKVYDEKNDKISEIVLAFEQAMIDAGVQMGEEE